MSMGDSRDTKVVPMTRFRSSPAEDRLEEIRQLFREAEPLEPDSLDEALQADRKAVNDEKEFIRRFGFDWPLRDRQELIRLKQQRRLTDREIRLFYLTGNLSRGPLGVRLSARLWVAAWGWVQIGVFLSLFGALLLVASQNLPQAPEKLLRIGGFLAFQLGLVWALYLTFVKPWRIQRRVMAEPADAGRG
jgi:hypothetical protein